jgi:hypothetical protein
VTPRPPAGARALRDWLAIPDAIEAALRGRSARELDARGGKQAWSPREAAHHLVEANLIATSIVLAALGTDGGRYDWTWVQPNTAWTRRMGYERVAVRPALAALRAVGRHLAAVLQAADGGLSRTVELWDAPGAPTYRKSVAQLLADEVAHAKEHLGELPRRARRA